MNQTSELVGIGGRPLTAKLNEDGVSVKGCSIIYAPRGQAGEYAPLATNPYRGCGHACAYCLSPDTLIQMADGTTKRLGAIAVGDLVIGIIKRGEQRRAWNYTYVQSEVLATIRSLKPAFRVTLENGATVVCSEDHRWLTERGWKHTAHLTTNNHVRVLGPVTATPEASERYRIGYLAGVIRGDGTLRRYDYSGRYRRAGRPGPQATDVQHQFRLAMNDTEALDRAAAYLEAVGVPTTRFDFQHAGGTMPAIRANSLAAFEAITRIVQPQADDEWLRGWLAGIFDAEGSTTARCVRVYNTDGAVLELVEVALARFGFTATRDVEQENGCAAVRVLGGLAETTRFFNLTAPAIRRKFCIDGSALRGSSRVVEVRALGVTIEMVDITTSTENFVADGMISHNCYVPKVLRMDRKDFDAGSVVRDGFLDALTKDARKYQHLGITEQVMLSFTTDPYPPAHHETTRRVLEILRDHGLGFCTLTKGGGRALRDLDLFRPDRDAFASTLTTLDDAFSRKWERGATLPGERIATLKRFHEAGIFTWVSLEPTLNTDASIAIIEATHGFVDLYKIGRANYLPMTKTVDWEDYTRRILEVVNRLGVRHYIKRDLQKHLPPGYPNPLRVPQHH